MNTLHLSDLEKKCLVDVYAPYLRFPHKNAYRWGLTGLSGAVERETKTAVRRLLELRLVTVTHECGGEISWQLTLCGAAVVDRNRWVDASVIEQHRDCFDTTWERRSACVAGNVARTAELDRKLSARFPSELRLGMAAAWFA